MVEGRNSGGGRGYDWIRHGGSRAEAAGVHELQGDKCGDGEGGVRPAWLTMRQGDRLEVLSEAETVGQV